MFFIKEMNHGIWKIVNKYPFIPIHEIDGDVVNKPEKDWTKDDKENM